MAEQIKSSLVRILNMQGKIVGTGFLVSEQHLITCAHVISQALGVSGLVVESAKVTLDFPFLAPKKKLAAKVIYYRLDIASEIETEGDDIAILKLEKPSPPSGAKPITLGDTGLLWEHNFRAFGFPAAHDQGVWVSGVLRETIVNGWLQVEDTKHTGYLISPGFSGAPVWDSDLEQVVGMVVATEQHPNVRAAFIIPNSILLQTYSGILNQPLVPPAVKQDSAANPFEYGRPVSPERFYGRFEQRMDVKNRLGAVTAQCISIVGLRRSGKSSLLHYIKDRTAEFCHAEQLPLIVHLDFQSPNFNTPLGITKGLKRGIYKSTGLTLWENDEDSYEVEDGLAKLNEDGHRLIILIDEFESITAHLEHFNDWGDDWRSKIGAGLFVLAVCSKRSLDDVYTICGLNSPFGNMFSTTILGAFQEREWRELVSNGFNFGARDLSNTDFELIDELAGGLPLYTQMAAAMLWQYGDHSKVRENFEFQARPRFNELWDDLTDAERKTIKRVVVKKDFTTQAGQGSYTDLKLHGVIRSEGEVFSSAFAKFVREMR